MNNTTCVSGTIKVSLSVIVPVFNVEKYISQCIESILNSNINEIEILLIDDGSTDRSGSICKEYEKKFESIKYYKKDNSGVSDTRNFGVSVARGEFIVFVDADDYISNSLLNDLLSSISDNDFAMAGFSEVNEIGNNIISTNLGVNFKGDISQMLDNIGAYIYPPYLLSPVFKIFRREIINTNSIIFPLDMSYGEDAVFVLEYLKHVRKVKCFQNPGYFYRRHGSGTLSTKFRKEIFDNDMRINTCIRELLTCTGHFNASLIVNERTIKCFWSFTKKLILSNLEYSTKKNYYYEYGYKFDISKLIKSKNKKGLHELLLLVTLKSKKLFPILLLYNLK